MPSASSIHGPTANAPPPFGSPESHTYSPPTTASVVETCSLPSGRAVTSAAGPTHVLTTLLSLAAGSVVTVAAGPVTAGSVALAVCDLNVSEGRALRLPSASSRPLPRRSHSAKLSRNKSIRDLLLSVGW